MPFKRKGFKNRYKTKGGIGMKICFPVLKADGLKSEVYGHFGSAPEFLVVETDSNKITTIKNKDQDHAHGACSPMKALNNQKIDAIVVGGIGAGALSRLNQLGIKVFRAQALTVKENISMLKTQNLPEHTLQHCCPGHGHTSGCKH
jgi:predicted Fe-Mo cluster-binding NifX family protein